jgi:pimeloyl-ACP methyl ester carboxylesterase
MTSPATVTYESADGALTLHAEESGSRKAPLAVLCLHGLTRNGRDFEALVARLSPRYRVITADQRGRGRSSWDPDPDHYRIPVYVQDMWRLLDRLQLQQVVLVGTSMGGLISMMMGATKPERVRGIVLNDIGPEVPPAGIARLRESLALKADVRDWSDAAALARRINAEAFPDYGEADWLAFAHRIYREDGSGRPMPGYDPAVLAALAPPPDPGAVTPTLWPVWAQLGAVPMLVIRGGLSHLLTADILERMVASHPRIVAVTLPNRGHAPMLDEPAAVSAIEGFLEDLVP